MAFNLEDLSPDEQDFVRQALADEQFPLGALGPSPAMIGNTLEALNTFTNKIPVLDRFTDKFDYEPGGFERFKERAAEQPLGNTGREVFDFVRGRMTDLPVLAGGLRALPALAGRGLSTAAGTATLGTKALGALGKLARSHPNIASILSSAGLAYTFGSGDGAEDPQAPQVAPSEQLAQGEDTDRLQEILSQTLRRDEILNAINSGESFPGAYKQRNSKMITVGKDDNLAEMGIGKKFSKTRYTPAKTKEMSGKETAVLQKIDSDIIPKFEEDALKIEENLRKAMAKGERDRPRKAGAEGPAGDLQGPEFDAYVKKESRRLAFSMVPPSLRVYIPSRYVEGV